MRNKNMGNFIKVLAYRIFEYPIKTQPICFYRQEDFTSSGVPIESEGSTMQFKKNLEAGPSIFQLRSKLKNTEMKDAKTSLKKVSRKFPGWNEQTIMCLHNLFLLFDDKKKAMLSPEDFCAILECLGESSSFEYRTSKFQEADVNGDQWLSYEEFLPAIYNFNPPSNGDLQGLAKLCLEASENIKFINNLSIGEQLEYGLF